jgi:hypothetical protein
MDRLADHRRPAINRRANQRRPLKRASHRAWALASRFQPALLISPDIHVRAAIVPTARLLAPQTKPRTANIPPGDQSPGFTFIRGKHQPCAQVRDLHHKRYLPVKMVI